ncbi:type IX secretion system anionic LPS delivery protein PorZ [Hymenobacter latericus]|uniref:type IX secretion system anionic LPS delivery protein PorZ n=1 Tax=Hymenobacter sp. YIM 151858-1 TaxID=2987688 RepID=UPI0022269908|nr:two-component regulator propeller domain-containing protein [Hymenobacter sp. YIM 151858-1]UYZ57717.1 T9SS type A sorting domain-containing protein [Hymenobacter sp. YIM 151858-1]
MTHALRLLLLLIGLACAAGQAAAQRTAAYGDWQLHLPTNRSLMLADAGKRVFVVAQDAFYAFDKETNSLQLLSRRDGLTDVGVSAVAYDSLTQQVVVAYRSGTVDVLDATGRLLTSYADIRRKAISGSKEIYSIGFARRLAYLSTSFGIVVLDLQRREIRDTYANIAPRGAVPQVYATAVLNDSLYAATSAGLLRGRLGTNLLDFNNWRGYPGFGPRPGNPYRNVVAHQGKVFAGINNDNLYRAVGAGLVSLGFGAADFRSLRSSGAGLLVAEPTIVNVLNTRTNSRYQLKATAFADIRDAVRAVSGPVYVADFRNGLVRIDANGQNAQSFVSNAPPTTAAFNILTDGATRTVTVFTGGYQENYLQFGSRNGFYQYDADGRWTSFNAQTLPANQYPNLLDLSRGTRTPDGTLYVASYGQGLLQWKGPGEFRVFGLGNSPLRSGITDPQDPNLPLFVRVTDVATDPDGNVWVVNRWGRNDVQGVTNFPGLFKFTPATNTWQAAQAFPGSGNLERLVFDDLGHAWVSRDRRSSPGLVAYDPETGRHRSIAIASYNLPAVNVHDLAKDRNGDIWAATDAGVAVYSNPGQVFDADAPDFARPVVRRGEGRGNELLYAEVVKAIAVDGANRKWFGTDNGLWLFSPDGDEGLLHFTTDNSPLPSNRIVDVAVDDYTGEVWVATDGGLVSYRGSATVTEGKVECAKVFPNPVRADFSGQVGISGLANNAEVKITDITGTLVYQTRATGGTVVWNLTDYNGRRVQSGVYLVLTADAHGKNGCISKVAVLSK